MANLLTLARVALIFLVIAIWGVASSTDRSWIELAMVPLMACAIFMDALDGWVARRWNEESEAGALFDIAGDRIVELSLWVFFATRRDPLGALLVPLWVPFVMISRTILTDLVRSVAFGQGRTPFGPNSMQSSGWAHQLTASRWSRAVYGIMKAICFCVLGLLAAVPGTGAEEAWLPLMRTAVDALVYLTVTFCIIRCVPVLWEGRRFFTPPPSSSTLADAPYRGRLLTRAGR